MERLQPVVSCPRTLECRHSSAWQMALAKTRSSSVRFDPAEINVENNHRGVALYQALNPLSVSRVRGQSRGSLGGESSLVQVDPSVRHGDLRRVTRSFRARKLGKAVQRFSQVQRQRGGRVSAAPAQTRGDTNQRELSPLLGISRSSQRYLRASPKPLSPRHPLRPTKHHHWRLERYDGFPCTGRHLSEKDGRFVGISVRGHWRRRHTPWLRALAAAGLLFWFGWSGMGLGQARDMRFFRIGTGGVTAPCHDRRPDRRHHQQPARRAAWCHIGQQLRRARAGRDRLGLELAQSPARRCDPFRRPRNWLCPIGHRALGMHWNRDLPRSGKVGNLRVVMAYARELPHRRMNPSGRCTISWAKRCSWLSPGRARWSMPASSSPEAHSRSLRTV